MVEDLDEPVNTPQVFAVRYPVPLANRTIMGTHGAGRALCA